MIVKLAIIAFIIFVLAGGAGPIEDWIETGAIVFPIALVASLVIEYLKAKKAENDDDRDNDRTHR